MVLQVRAVFTLVVIGAFAEVVRGQVETLRPVLTWVGLAVIDIQLYRRKIYKRRKESSMMRGKMISRHFWILRKQSNPQQPRHGVCQEKAYQNAQENKNK